MNRLAHILFFFFTCVLFSFAQVSTPNVLSGSGAGILRANGQQTELFPAWTASTSYVVGDVVRSSNQIYRCKTAHTSGGSFSATNWDEMSPAGAGSNTFTGKLISQGSGSATGNTGAAGIEMQNSVSSKSVIIAQVNNGDLQVQTTDGTGTASIVLQQDGDLGIGIAVPQHKMDVNGGVKGDYFVSATGTAPSVTAGNGLGTGPTVSISGGAKLFRDKNNHRNVDGKQRDGIDAQPCGIVPQRVRPCFRCL